MSKIIDTVTFFNENFIYDLRYNVIKDYVDYLVVCESKFDHKGNPKKLRFNYEKYSSSKKIKYIVLEQPFPKNNNPWKNQAIQREYLLKNLNFASDEDYIFFSDPDEIPNPKILTNFILKKKYGIFLQKNYNLKFNYFNPHESPWDGPRVCKKKDLKSIDYVRQKVWSKNLKYKFYRIDKEKNIQLFDNGGWHFNNMLKPEDISLKLKTFAHTEYSGENYSSIDKIKEKINKGIDLFNRGYKFIKVDIDETFPEYLIKNKEIYKDFIIK